MIYMGGFPKSKVPFFLGGSHTKDFSVLGSVLGFPEALIPLSMQCYC